MTLACAVLSIVFVMPFLGRDKCIDHNHTLYMPLDVAYELGYDILDKWVEEI